VEVSDAFSVFGCIANLQDFARKVRPAALPCHRTLLALLLTQAGRR
jgi:hypothetical protein